MATKRRKQTVVQNLDTPATTTAQLRSQLSTCTGKICAYRDVGKETEAGVWADKLRAVLEMNQLFKHRIV